MTDIPNLETHLEEGIGRLQDGLDGFAGEPGAPFSARMQGPAAWRSRAWARFWIPCVT
ncbi:hypothetical protein RAA17_20595 [Komagataeibacter rhaeticus]|nr:hypothetical protein [Komagataeibacter rhaeticus]